MPFPESGCRDADVFRRPLRAGSGWSSAACGSSGRRWAAGGFCRFPLRVGPEADTPRQMRRRTVSVRLHPCRARRRRAVARPFDRVRAERGRLRGCGRCRRAGCGSGVVRIVPAGPEKSAIRAGAVARLSLRRRSSAGRLRRRRRRHSLRGGGAHGRGRESAGIGQPQAFCGRGGQAVGLSRRNRN